MAYGFLVDGYMQFFCDGVYWNDGSETYAFVLLSELKIVLKTPVKVPSKYVSEWACWADGDWCELNTEPQN